MDQIVRIVDTLSNTPPEMLAFLAAGLPLSAIQQKLNKWFHAQKDWLKVMITLTVSLLAVGIPHALNWVTLNPEFFAGYSATVFAGMTLFYRWIVKPASANLAEFKEFKQNQNEAPAAPAPRAPGKFLGQCYHKRYEHECPEL